MKTPEVVLTTFSSKGSPTLVWVRHSNRRMKLAYKIVHSGFRYGVDTLVSVADDAVRYCYYRQLVGSANTKYKKMTKDEFVTEFFDILIRDKHEQYILA